MKDEINEKTKIESLYSLIGARIKYLRITREWTQMTLSKKTSMTRASIANIEAGRQRMLLHDIEKFAMVFDLPVKLLMRGIWY